VNLTTKSQGISKPPALVLSELELI